MQAAHPLAVSGLLAHTDSLDDPYERLARTAEVMSTIGFGTRADADRVTRRVREMHRRVRGRLREPAGPYPAGTPYAADDPGLLLWVLFTLVDSALVVYRRYVGPLSGEEEAAYWEDFKVVGGLFGLRAGDMPDDRRRPRRLPAPDARRRRAATSATGRASGRGRSCWSRRCRGWSGPLLETVNFITVALLPDRIREGYGFSPLPPVPLRRAVVAGGAEYVKRAVIPFLPDRLRLVPAARAA